MALFDRPPTAALLLLLLLATCQLSNVQADVAATETLVGIVGRDFILLGADSSISGGSVAFTATNLDKIALLVDPFPSLPAKEDLTNHSKNPAFLSRSPHSQQTIAAAVAGDAADADRLVGLLHAYGAIHEYENGLGCDVEFYTRDATTTSHSNDNDSLLQQMSQQTNIQMAGLSVEQMAHLARRFIYDQLRSQTPYQVGMLVAGMMAVEDEVRDEMAVEDIDGMEQLSLSARVRQQVQVATSFASDQDNEKDPAAESKTVTEDQKKVSLLVPHLYWLDQYGSLQRMKEYAVHGYAGSFLWSLLDKSYHPDMSVAEAHELLQNCFRELRQRYLINQVAAPPCIKCIDANGCRLLS